jgi:hypothetical protein
MFYVFTSFVKRDKLIFVFETGRLQTGGQCRVLARTDNSSFSTALPLAETCIQLAHEEELIRI